MAKFTLRVDTSYYGKSGEFSKSVVGVGFEIVDETNGREEVIVSEAVGGEACLYGSTEAELYGIRLALEQFFDEVGDVSPLVLDVVCDSDSALEALDEGQETFEVCADVWELIDGLYSVSWEIVDREEMWDVDDMATRAQRRVRD